MASATGIPATIPQTEGYGEEEPLLGRIGDASQQEGRPLYHNLFIGTAVIAQVGILLLAISVWASVFTSPLSLFSAHPLLNSAGVLAITEAIIILQPTHTADQKRKGTTSHFLLINFGLDALIAGLVVIEYNKFSHNGLHFRSPHAILGLITYILLGIQAAVGFTQYYVPKLYGSVDKARSVYKYHRISGYVILVLIFATIAAATQTDFNKDVLSIKLWAVLLTSILTLVGVIARIKKQKLGLGLSKPSDSGAFGQ